ncbi:amino acid ABC transporter substrate-binding protein [Pseudomaricurvus alkylphenolicus]|uniref:substrate-binding periplasmic protein n=1 Tax=Pseudomaricurvus alkylphenolicus TaxID=1306991 RepID=UPI00142108A7|nr:transporter substrate-binding domain-containing protein [Pseudomaricurvus alkylphenolicus]NIB40676.1 amino acid ABC transporter substrate-binding protein [Pseudomaricurvus alkylphenolicus]
MKFTGAAVFSILACVLTMRSYADKTLTFSAVEGSINCLVSERVLKEAYKRLQIDIKIRKLPAARALHESNIGVYDGELYRIRGVNKEYPNLVPITVPINVMEGVVFTEDIHFSVNGWESLKPFRLGIQRGAKFVDRGSLVTERDNIQVVNTYAQLFKMLKGGRIEVVVASRLSGLNAMQANGITGITMLGRPLERYDLYHYLHKKNKHLVDDLSSVLMDMDKEGLIKRIRREFIRERF